MRVSRYFTKQFDNQTWTKLFFRHHDLNLGPLIIPMPTIYATKRAIPIQSRDDPDLSFENIVSGIIDEAIKQNNNSDEQVEYSVQEFPFTARKKNAHIQVFGDSSALEDALSQGLARKFFRRKNMGYTEWLRLFFDWTKPVELHEDITTALELQSQAHNLMRLIGDHFLFDAETGLIKAEDKLRIAGMQSKEYIDFLAGDRKAIPDNMQKVWDQRMDVKRNLSRQIGQLRKGWQNSTYDHLPGEVFALLLDLKDVDYQVRQLIEPFGGSVEQSFRHYLYQLFLPGYDIMNLKFLDRADDSITNVGSWDIETTKYRGSIRTPGQRIPKDPRVWLIALSANRGVPEEFAYLLDNPLFELPDSIDWPVSDIAVGYLDIGADHIVLDSEEKIPYIFQQDAHHVVRTFSFLHQVFQLSVSGGHNTWSYDASRAMNPNRDLIAIADLHPLLEKYDLYRDLFTKDQGMCRLSSDNSGPAYRSNAWPTQFDFTAKRADTLNPARFYLSGLTLDQTLESLSALIHFITGTGFGFKKSIVGYDQVEAAVAKGELGDSDGAKEAVAYGAGDTIGQLDIMNNLVPIYEFISQTMKIPFDDIFQSPPKNVASLFWQRKFAQKSGIIKSYFELKKYEEFDLQKSKRKALEIAYSGTQNSELITRKGAIENVAMLMTPFFSESTHEIIEQDPVLASLRERLISSNNILEKVVLQKILDNLAVYYLLDAKTSSLNGKPADGALYHRYGIQGGYNNNAKYLLDMFRQGMIDLAEPLNERIVNYTGDYVFIDNDPELIKQLVDLDYTFIGEGDAISVSPHSIIYQLNNENNNHLAATGFKIQSPKKRHTPDYLLKGFNPNFYDNWIHDIAVICLNEGLKRAGEHIEEQITNMKKLPAEEFFMTLKPGKKFKNYSFPYRNTLRYKLEDLANLEPNQSRVVVIGSDDCKHIDLQIVDANEPDSWNQQPFIPFYLKMAFDPNKNLMKLCKSLGLKQVVDQALNYHQTDFT
ncbi:MAG: hypothetical protein MAG795_00407 [Candidatus Woesearchaeota archaeon]|nr:hypothetical protein [Candidatus Woesearchaeota archaeon]